MSKTITVRIAGDAKGFSDATKKAKSDANKLKSDINTAGLAIGGTLLAIGGFSLEMADKFETSHARLETAVKNTGGSFDTFKGAVGNLDSKMEKLGFTNADTEGNLSTLVGVTKNTTRAIADMSIAADVARGRNIDLQSATELVTKVESGHVGLLGRLGINIKDVNGKTVDQATALRRLADLYGGDASAYANTFAGKMATLKATGEDLGKNIGMFLIPIINALGGVVSGVVGWLEQNKTVAYALAIVVGTVLVAALTAFMVLKVQAFIENITGAMRAMGLMAEQSGGEVAAAWVAAAGPLAILAALVVGVGAGLASTFSGGNAVKIRSTGNLLDSVTGISRKQLATINGLGIAHSTFKAILDKSAPAAQEFLTKAKAAGINTKGWHEELDKANTKLNEQATAQDNVNAALASADTADISVTSSTKDLNDALTTTDDTLKTIKTHWEALLGVNQDATSAQYAFNDSLEKEAEALFSSRATFDENTSAGRANMEQGIDTAKAAEAHAEAVYKQTGSIDAATNAMKFNETQQYNQLTAFGLSTDAAVKLTAKMYGIPDDVATNFHSNADVQTYLVSVLHSNIDSLPPSHNTTITANTDDATTKINNLITFFSRLPTTYSGTITLGGGSFRQRAGGGPVIKGMPYIVGENRAELFVPNESGTIIPKVPAMAGGGGNSYAISVQVGATANTAQIGAEIVNAIKQYERRSGTGWRG